MKALSKYYVYIPSAEPGRGRQQQQQQKSFPFPVRLLKAVMPEVLQHSWFTRRPLQQPLLYNLIANWVSSSWLRFSVDIRQIKTLP